MGTERHESRRIDNQLRGRAGRQGDPGASRFYLSLDDDLMRIFGSVNIGRFMEEDLPIEHRWITKAIENAQRKVEGHNYDIRKHLLEYDDVMNSSAKSSTLGAEKCSAQPSSARHGFLDGRMSSRGAIADDFFPNGKLRRSEWPAFLDVKELNDAVRTTLQFRRRSRRKTFSRSTKSGLKNVIIKYAHDVL